MVSFAPENTLSASEDVAGIEKISIAIDDKRENLDLWAGLIYHEIKEPTSIKQASETYYSNSSRLSIGCTCFLTIHRWKALLLVPVSVFARSTLCTKPVEER